MSLYSQLLERVLLPLHNLARGRKYVERLRFLDESQWWSRERLLEFQWRETRSLLEHCFCSVPYYQKKYGDAGIRLDDIRSMEDVSCLPVLTRAEVNENRQALCSTAYRGKLLPHATGGSSGVPTRFFRTIESYDWRTAAMDRVYGWSGYRPGERTAYLWGAPVGHVPQGQLLKARTHNFILRHLVFNTFSQSQDHWRDIYTRTIAYRPKWIVGYVSSLEEFSRFLEREGKSLSGVKAVIAAAEPLDEPARLRISNGIGAPVFNTYGSREFMSIAGECEEHKGLHINSENMLIETALSPEEGPSEILVTDLHNYGMPFLRYSIGDAGVLDETPCSCGRGLPRLRTIDGRILDLLKTANGRLVPGEFFPHLLKDVPEILEYQVEQRELDRIKVSVVLSHPLSQNSQEFLEGEFKKVIGDGTRVEITNVDRIERLPSGKRRAVVGLPSAR